MPHLTSHLLMCARIAALAVACACACAWSEDGSARADEDLYLAAIAAHDYARADSTARAHLDAEADARWWAYLATAKSLAGAHRAAVDAYMRCECAGGAAFLDKNMLYLRAGSLARVQAHARARATLDLLARRYQFSRLAAKDEELGVRIDQRLSEGVDRSNLNWYAREMSAARSEPGLAIDFGEEYLLLAARATDATPEDAWAVRTALATAYLQLGAGERASERLAPVPDDYQDFRGVLLKGMARYAGGDAAEASALVRVAAERTTDAHVRERAARLLNAWTR